jgi:hypothetical protein
LEISGLINTDLSKLSANNVMSWGMSNIWRNEVERGYIIRHGQKPVWDFPESSKDNNKGLEEEIFFKKAYPCLFPWGHRGIERQRV